MTAAASTLLHNPLLGYRTALQGVGFFKGETAVATLLESINGNNLEEHKVKFDAKDAIRFMRCISKSHICQLAFPARSQLKLSEKHTSHFLRFLIRSSKLPELLLLCIEIVSTTYATDGAGTRRSRLPYKKVRLIRRLV